METHPSILCTGSIEIPENVRTYCNDIVLDVVPYIEVRAINDDHTQKAIQKVAASMAVVVFTSFNAVTAVAECIDAIPENWQIYCLSGKTQETVVKHFGVGKIVAVAPDSATLASIIAADGVTHAIFFCGNIRMDTLPVSLAEKGVKLTELIVYFTEAQTSVANKHYDGILFFSPSAVRSYFLQNKPHDNTTMFAIGNTTAAEIAKYCRNDIVVAATPSKEKMLLMAAQWAKETRQ